MNSEIITAILALAGTAIGSLSGIIASARLTNFRLAKLEEKVEMHNNLVERMTAVEQRSKSNTHRINALEEIVRV